MVHTFRRHPSGSVRRIVWSSLSLTSVASIAVVVGFPPKIGAGDAQTVPVQRGRVTFTPCDEEGALPAMYRLTKATFPFEVRVLDRGPKVAVYDVRFPSPVQSPHPANNTVYAEYYVPRDRPKRLPGIVMLHVLDGRFRVARVFSRYLAGRGAAVLFVKMAYYGPRRPKGTTHRMLSADLDGSVAAIRQTVLDVRRARAWLVARPEVDATRTALAGVSLGGLMTSVAGAVEPRFRRVVPMLAGGDFARILYHSHLTAALREAWESRGGTREQLADLLRPVDPATHAPRLAGRQVLMICAARDDVIPPACGKALWQAAGRPPIVWLDATHVGTVVYVPQMLELVGRYLVEWETITTENLPGVLAAVQTQPAGVPKDVRP